MIYKFYPRIFGLNIESRTILRLKKVMILEKVYYIGLFEFTSETFIGVGRPLEQGAL
jgi:hypothetical protein